MRVDPTPYIAKLLAREVALREAEVANLAAQYDQAREVYINLTARLAEARTQHQIAVEAKQEMER